MNNHAITNASICLVENYQIRDPQLQSFSSFTNLEKFSQDVADAELLGKIKLVQFHGHSIVEKIKQIQEKSCSDISQASSLFPFPMIAKFLLVFPRNSSFYST